MAKEALLKVVEAEKEADQMIKKAKEDAKEMAILADKRSKKILEELTIKARIECDRLGAQAQEEMKGELDSIALESDKRCRSIIEIPQDRFDEAKKILIERIVK